MAIGDKATHMGQWQVLVDFDAGLNRYRSIWPSSLTKTVLYWYGYSRDTEVMDYEWGRFNGFHNYWV